MAEWKWIDTLTRQFELCEATNGRDVVVVGTTRTPADLIDTAMIALQRTGAQGSLLVLASPGSGESRTMSASVQSALRTAELVIDCTAVGLGPLPDTDVLVLGSRSPVGLEHHVPHPGLSERVRMAEKLLSDGTQLVITSAAGTKLSILGTDDNRSFGDQTTISGDWGCPRPQRRLAHWPAGQVTATLSETHTASGQVVLMPGDLNLTLAEVIHSPVTLEIEDSRICEIVGESGDADLLRAYLESFADPGVYLLTRATLGLNQAATSPSLFTTDPQLHSELAAGQVSLGFGHPSNSTDTYPEPLLTIGLRTATLDLGSVRPVSDGTLQGEVAPDVYESAANLNR